MIQLYSYNKTEESQDRFREKDKTVKQMSNVEQPVETYTSNYSSLLSLFSHYITSFIHVTSRSISMPTVLPILSVNTLLNKYYIFRVHFFFFKSMYKS